MFSNKIVILRNETEVYKKEYEKSLTGNKWKNRFKESSVKNFSITRWSAKGPIKLISIKNYSTENQWWNIKQIKFERLRRLETAFMLHFLLEKRISVKLLKRRHWYCNSS